MRSCLRSVLAVCFSLLACSLAISADLEEEEKSSVRFHKIDAWDQTLADVVTMVDDEVLSHTTQLFPLDEKGKLVGGISLGEQLKQTFKNLDSALKAGESSISEVVKLNLYAATPEVAAEMQVLFDKSWPGENRPAIAMVVTPLPVQGALIAMDAVGVAREHVWVSFKDGKRIEERDYIEQARVMALGGPERALHVANLMQGNVLYVSGQAEPGDTIHAAAKATFEGLFKTLKHYEVSADAIVQFKAFVHPISKADEVQQALEEVMPKGNLPPIVFVQWEAPGSVEIELIAAAPPAKDVPKGETISFLTPPWMSSSPNFCRVTRVHGSKRVYFPGITARKPGDGAAQVKDMFNALGKAAKAVGTDYEHLAKATYYVSDDDASSQLNKLRPEYYNPKRPPAASKAAVKHVGTADRSFMMDMIGVGR